MEKQLSPLAMLKNVKKEIADLQQAIDSEILSKDKDNIDRGINETELNGWINHFNDLIRRLDKMVETLQQYQAK